MFALFLHGPVLHTYTNHPWPLATAAALPKQYGEMKSLALGEL